MNIPSEIRIRQCNRRRKSYSSQSSIEQVSRMQQASTKRSQNEALTPNQHSKKGVRFGCVSQHKIFKGLDPEGSVEYLTRFKLNQSLTDVWESLEDYEAEKSEVKRRSSVSSAA